MTRVVVAGRDASLWLAALAIRRALAPAGVEVVAVELPTRLAEADCYATLPPIEALHARIGLDEAALLRATGGVFSHGTNLIGEGTASFFLGMGSHGAAVGEAAFFPTWVMARRHGLDARLQDFSLAATAATNGRLMLGDEVSAGFGRVDYAYSLPARRYVGVLKGIAPRLGITAFQAAAIAAERKPDADGIAAVMLDGYRRVEGDLFVDATGSEGLLATTLSGAREDWRAAFPADRRMVARAPALRAIPPYAEMRANTDGWLRLQPTRADTRIVQAYSSALTGDEAALAVATRTAGLPLADVAVEAIAPGRLSAPWHGNCVAIGAAACAVDPALGIDLHVAQLGIVHLLSLFPAGPAIAAAERNEYNRLLASSYDRLRDAQQALYAAAPWSGRFWDQARAASVPPALAHKIATFRARGEVTPLEDETFDPAEWQALLVGLGVMPDSWPPAIDRLHADAIRTSLRGMLGFVREKVIEQSMHDAYLDEVVGRSAAA